MRNELPESENSGSSNSEFVPISQDDIFEKQPVIASPNLEETIRKIDVIPVFDDVMNEIDDSVDPYTRMESETYIKKCLEDESLIKVSDIEYIGRTYPDIIQCKPEEISQKNLSLLRKSSSVNKYVFVKDFSHLPNQGMYHVQAFMSGDRYLVSRAEWVGSRVYHNPMAIEQDEHDAVIDVYRNIIAFTKNPITFYREALSDSGILVHQRPRVKA